MDLRSLFLILSIVYHKLCFSTLTNPSDLYRRKRSWNWNMFMIEQWIKNLVLSFKWSYRNLLKKHTKRYKTYLFSFEACNIYFFGIDLFVSSVSPFRSNLWTAKSTKLEKHVLGTNYERLQQAELASVGFSSLLESVILGSGRETPYLRRRNHKEVLITFIPFPFRFEKWIKVKIAEEAVDVT